MTKRKEGKKSSFVLGCGRVQPSAVHTQGTAGRLRSAAFPERLGLGWALPPRVASGREDTGAQ